MSWNQQNQSGGRGRGYENYNPNNPYTQNNAPYSQNNPYANPNYGGYPNQQYQQGGYPPQNYGYQQQNYGYQQNQQYGYNQPPHGGYNQNQQYGGYNQYQENQQFDQNRGRGGRNNNRRQDFNNRQQQKAPEPAPRRQQPKKAAKKDPTLSMSANQKKSQLPKAVEKPVVNEVIKQKPPANTWADDDSDNEEPAAASAAKAATNPPMEKTQTKEAKKAANAEEEVETATNLPETSKTETSDTIETSDPAPEPVVKKSKKKDKKKRPKVKAHDPREHLNLVFIGHVDAGKSTLSGQILLKTGLVDLRTVAKYEKEAKQKNRESWWIAYIMDTSEEERAKGKTVECGRAHFETENKRYTILDAPGHKNYVPHMISGAAQADVACLVISARKGEFEAGFDRGGQTREHAQLAHTLGIKRLLIVINKMDCVGWGKDRYDEILSTLNPFLKKTGFKTKDIDVIPVSGQAGINIKERFEEGVCDWYKGPSLLEAFDSLKKIKRDKKSSLRIPVMDRYKDMGCIMAIGKVEANKIYVGDKVRIMPSGKTADVHKLMVDDEQVEMAGTGENVVVGLKGISDSDIHGGYIICGTETWTPKATTVECQVQLLELLPHKPLFSIGYSAVFHSHNLAVECECVTIPHILQKKTGRKSAKPPKFLKSNDPGIIRFKLDHASCVETYDDYPQLGRFTLRDEGKTVALGKVLRINYHLDDEESKK